MNQDSQQILKLSHLGIGQDREFHYTDENSPWLEDLLKFLNKEVVEQNETIQAQQNYLSFSGKISKKREPQFGEVILLVGTLESEYNTICVNSLELMVEKLEIELNACFIDHSFESDEGIADEIQLVIENELRDLYFYKNKQLDLKEVVLEFIELNRNPFPKKNEFDQKKYWQES